MDSIHKMEHFNTYTEELFRFSQEEAEMLMEGGDAVSLKKGETLYNAGDPNEYIFYMSRGSVKFHIIYPDGSSQTTAFSRAPSIVGVINLNPAQTAANSCTALTRCEFRTLPIGLFMERLRKYDLMEKMLFFSVGAARHAYLNLLALHSGDRIRLTDTLRNKCGLTLQETADYIGCSRVHVSRLLKQYKQSRVQD